MNTDATARGGAARKSDEGAVMALEQRGGVTLPILLFNRD
jgi:hypothetical protein